MTELITIGLSINGGKSEEFSFRLDAEVAERIERVYRERVGRDGLDNTQFWSVLNRDHADLAAVVERAIVDSLKDCLFNDDFCLDECNPDSCFPLCDLHFDYLTAEGKVTLRHLNCARGIIYYDNVYDCDFSFSF